MREGDLLELRRYEPGDHEAVVVLHRLGIEQTGADPGPGPWDDDLASPQAVAATYLQLGGEFLVGVRDDEIVAMGALRPTETTRVELKRMRVHPRHQRRGYGRAVLLALESRACELGHETIHLDTTTLQLAAIALYEQNGYAEIGRRQHGLFELILFEKRLTGK